MQVINGLENIGSASSASVTVGSFDGLHLGHQRILHLMQTTKTGLTTVLTFEPHPQSIVRPDIPPPPQLTTRDERIELFREIGVDKLVFSNFDEKFAAMSAEDYVQRILVGILGVKKLFIGPNHRFGKDRLGDVALLRKMEGELGFEVFVVEPVRLGDQIISSSRIRRCLAAGDAETGHKMLGKPYYLIGKVVRGDGRGRQLGFPTANLSGISAGKLMPPSGIYTSVTEIGGLRWPSVSHIGPRPTFPGADPTIETHLIGFDDDLYELKIRIGLVARQREVAAFHDVSALIEQMMIDRRQAIDQVAEMGYSFKSSDRLYCLTQNTSFN